MPASDNEVCSSPEAMPQLLLTYEDAGHLLGGLSARQVRRMVAQGTLSAVTVADRARRIHIDEVTEYAARLRDGAHGLAPGSRDSGSREPRVSPPSVATWAAEERRRSNHNDRHDERIS